MRKEFVVLGLIFLIGFSSAGGCYNSGKRVFLNYDEDVVNRYPVEDYRHGYSYRATGEFRDRYGLDGKEKRVDGRLRVNRGKFAEKSYYYKWSSHLREFEKVECYRSAPSGKLFYRKCPGFH